MRLFWTGTDALMMVDLSKRKLRKRPFWLVMRVIVKFLDRHALESHITNWPGISMELRQFGVKKPIELRLTPLKYTKKLERVPHRSFNILYYKPYGTYPKFRDWLYGIDLIERLKKDIPEANFIEVGLGTDAERNMELVYPHIDFMVRPNRHDGYSRMVRECDIQDISYYWSDTNPDYELMRKKVYEAIQNHRKG